MQDFGMLSMTSNFDNELEILKSRTLIKKVVSRLNLYTNIAIEQSSATMFHFTKTPLLMCS